MPAANSVEIIFVKSFNLDICGKTIRQVLAKRRFYLDLKSRTAQTTKQLVQDLIALGGVSIITISYFLHKLFSILFSSEYPSIRN